MAKSHQTELIIRILRLFHEFLDPVPSSDFIQHIEDGLIRATMGWTPE